MSRQVVGPAADRWRSLSPAARVGLVFAAVVVGANVVAVGSRTAGRGPRGEPSSAFATTPDGLSAWATLLDRSGYPVRRERRALDDVDLAPDATLVVADPFGLTPEESDAVDAFVRDGGRLVAAGGSAVPLARRLVPDLDWTPRGPRLAIPLTPAPEVAGVDEVLLSRDGSFAPETAALPILGGNDGDEAAIVAVAAEVGAGRVVALASSAPLQNRALARADNAAFALRLAGSPGRPVLFAEAAHGYGESGGLFGLDALPGRWPAAVVTACAAGLVWAWSRGRRFGPADDDAEVPPPARGAYVDALAGVLSRSGRPGESTVALRGWARGRLASRLGLPADASDGAVVAAATRAGYPPGEVDAVLRPAATDADLLALGRAVSGAEGSLRP